MALPTRIECDGAPGGLVMILYVDERESVVQRIASHLAHDTAFIDASAISAADQGRAAWMDGHDVALQVFDGDEGRLVLRIPTLDSTRDEWMFFAP